MSMTYTTGPFFSEPCLEVSRPEPRRKVRRLRQVLPGVWLVPEDVVSVKAADSGGVEILFRDGADILWSEDARDQSPTQNDETTAAETARRINLALEET